MSNRAKIAVFASGEGTNFEAIVAACERGELSAEVVLVVCDKPNANVVGRANEHNVECFAFSPKEHASKEHYEEEIVRRLDEKGVDPYADVLSEEKYRELFGYVLHPFTGVDYVDYYAGIIHEAGSEVEIVFANQAKTILNYTDCVLTCDIHTRQRTKRILKAAGAKVVCGLDDILNAPVNGSGCNEKYGLLGSNKSTEDTVKLFPRDCQGLVEDIQAEFLKRTGKHIEVMVYGDGAFKDPQGKIWELADPVVSPAHTSGLIGTPNELKLKYLADNDFKGLSGAELKEAISKSIKAKQDNLVGNMASQGTTPRQLTDLIGSLCDLTSGSGDKGTPIILVQGYFDNYTD